MTRARIAFALTAVALVAAVLLFGGLFHDSVGALPAPPPEAAAGGLGNELGAGDTASLVRSLQATLRRNPTDVHAYDLLGLAYQQLARETGDPAYYTKSEGVLRRGPALSPNDLLATSGFCPPPPPPPPLPAALSPRPLGPRTARCGRAAVPDSAVYLSGLRLRARRSRPGRGRARPLPPRDGARAARRRDDPAAAVRDDARRPGAREGARPARSPPIRARRRDSASARRERRQDGPRGGALRRRPRRSPPACPRPRATRVP